MKKLMLAILLISSPIMADTIDLQISPSSMTAMKVLDYLKTGMRGKKFSLDEINVTNYSVKDKDLDVLYIETTLVVDKTDYSCEAVLERVNGAWEPSSGGCHI